MLRHTMGSLAAGLLGLALWATSASAQNAGVGAGNDWPNHNGDTSESSYSQLSDINVSNIGRLGLAWSLDLPGEGSLEATPVAVNGVLYFTGAHAIVYAVDAASGKLLWKFDPQTWKYAPAKMHFMINVNRGVAYAGGRIFSAALDGRLFALDAKTGKLIWTVQTVPLQSPQDITGAPRVFDGKVIIGNGGADYAARGYITAYDQATGKQVWRFYAAPGSPEENRGDPAMERAAATWTGKYWKTGTGGGPWDGITFDPEFNRIYFGTGNAAPYDPSTRSPGGGDNLYTVSIVALDANTGKYVWHYQINPRDAWDYDSTQQITLADLKIDGKLRKVLMQAPKSGFFYVIDRTTGKVISAAKVGKVTWADRIDLATGRPVEEKNIRYEKGNITIWPATIGAHNWQTMSFDPKTGLVYIPYMQLATHWVRGKPQPGGVDIGGVSLKAINPDPADDKGALIAWDPVNQKPVWRALHDAIWNGGIMATAGGLVFQGAGDGYITAYDAATGKSLWRFNAGLGVSAAPMSYMVGGKQFISILAGYGGTQPFFGELMNAGWKFSAPHRLLTFAIDGKAVLPPSPPADKTVHALDDPKLVIKAADVSAGEALYGMSCAMCHGHELVSGGAQAPDLRESEIALHPDTVYSVVHDGALLARGMPRFENLTRDQIMQIFAYIRAGARDALKNGGGQGRALR